MMKFCTLALALIAATPFANVAAEYVCHNDAFFHTKDDVSVQLSKAVIGSLQSAMVDAFEEAYKNIDDIDMTSNKLQHVSYNVCISYYFLLLSLPLPLPLLLYFVSFRFASFRFISNASIVGSATSSLCYLILISNRFFNILLLYSSTLDPMRQPLFFVETMSTANLDGPDALEVVGVGPSILLSRDPHLVSLLPPRRNTSCGRNCFVKRLVPTRNSPLWKDVPLF